MQWICANLHNQSNNQKIATVEKGKPNTLALEGNCIQSKCAVTTEVIMESYSCRTCIHPQGSLQKLLNILPTKEQTIRTFNKMESSQKIPTLYIVNGAYVSPKVFNKLKNMYVAMYSEWLQWISKFMSPHKQEKLCAWCRWAIRLFCLRRICFPVLMQCDQEPFRVVIGNLG